MGEKVAVAMSGGVDSSTAAYLLLQQGFEVAGFFMKLFKEADPSRAEAVARHLGIEFHIVDLSREFEELVVGPFVEAYLRGKTPNPCARCNPLIKFGRLFDVAKERGCSMMATGHYARVKRDEAGRAHLLRALHAKKDQSYFLFGIPKDRLARITFPLGGMTKDEAREIAARAGIPAQPSESQDICFLTTGDYRDFIEARVDEPPGAGQIIDVSGRVRGIHRGFYRYTIGQRHGLGIRSRRPLYVVGIDPERNIVIVGRERNLYKRAIKVGGLNLLEDVPRSFEAQVKVRSRMEPVRAMVKLEDGGATVEFERPVRAPTRGQAAVFYDGELVIGGGWIEDAA